jgi:hypothetical protein
MEVKFLLERSDLLAFQKYIVSQHKPSGWVVLVMIGPLAVFFCLWIGTAIWLGDPPDGKWIGIFGGGMVWSFKRIVVYGQQANFKDTLDRFRQVPWTIRIAPEEVTIESPTFRVVYSWLHFYEIVQTGNHHLFFIGKYTAHIIPRRCFSSDQDFLDFGHLCRRYFDEAEHTASPSSSPPIPSLKPDGFTHAPPKR